MRDTFETMFYRVGMAEEYQTVLHLPTDRDEMRLASEWTDETTPRTDNPIRFLGYPEHRESVTYRGFWTHSA